MGYDIRLRLKRNCMPRLSEHTRGKGTTSVTCERKKKTRQSTKLFKIWRKFFDCDGSAFAVSRIDDGFTGEKEEFFADGADEGVIVPAGKIGATNRATEKGIPGENETVISKVIAYAAWSVSRGMDNGKIYAVDVWQCFGW